MIQTLEDFAKKYLQMRNAQKNYFLARKTGKKAERELFAAKALESELDRAVAETLKEIDEGKNRLFALNK